MHPIIIIHGGAGDTPDDCMQGKYNGIRMAIRVGYQTLLKSDNALDAVEAAIMSMEKDEYFNAGYGTVLNIEGGVEMEASIMRGSDLNVGAVTLVKNFTHPISIARKVLTDSPHTFLGGQGVKLFALQQGGVGTVGAVAMDSHGRIAAGTSTGGLSGKAVGRIGDTAQIGSGTYADDAIGGVSATGHGESVMKHCLAHSIIKLMERGVDANTATKSAINALTTRLKNPAGAITLSNNGDLGIYFTTKRMPWAYIKSNRLYYGINCGEILEDNF